MFLFCLSASDSQYLLLNLTKFTYLMKRCRGFKWKRWSVVLEGRVQRQKLTWTFQARTVPLFLIYLLSGVFILSVWPIGHYSSLRHFSCQCFSSLRIKSSPSSWEWLFHHPSKLISFSLYWFVVCVWHHLLTG